MEAFAKAVSLDNRYAAAHSMLAFALSFVAENEPGPAARGQLMERALAAADQAVALGPSESDAFATRGYLRFEIRKDFAGANADFQKAMQLDPNAVPTLAKYSNYLAEVVVLNIEVVDLGSRCIAAYDYQHLNRNDDFQPLMKQVLEHDLHLCDADPSVFSEPGHEVIPRPDIRFPRIAGPDTRGSPIAGKECVRRVHIDQRRTGR